MAVSAPEDLTVQVGCVAGRDGAPVVMIVPTWCGAPEEGEARVAPFLKLGTLLAGAMETTSYAASLTAFDGYSRADRTNNRTLQPFKPALLPQFQHTTSSARWRVEAVLRGKGVAAMVYRNETAGVFLVLWLMGHGSGEAVAQQPRE